MTEILLSNNAFTTLPSGIGAGDTSFAIQTGHGARFPNPGAGQRFKATLQDPADASIYEIVHVTAKSGDSFTTVIRGQEDTDAFDWPAGTLVELRWTTETALAYGVPPGGTTGQVLSKASDDDYDTTWDDAGSGSSPGGPDGSIQFADSGALAGSAELGYDDVTTTITFGSINGDAFFMAPIATGSDTGGNLALSAGDSIDDSSGGVGGAIAVHGGSGDGTGGEARLAGGLVGQVAGGATGVAGDGVVQGGDDISAGGGTAGNVRLIGGTSSSGTAGSVKIEVNGALFMEVTPAGSIKFSGDEGDSGDILKSSGPGAPVSWGASTPTLGEILLSSLTIVGYAHAIVGSAAPTAIGMTMTNAASGGGSGTFNPDGSTALKSVPSITLEITVSSANLSVGWLSNLAGFRIATSGFGGFVYKARFGVDSSPGTERYFIGMFSSPLAPPAQTVDPSSFANCIMLAKDAADTDLSLMHNDGSGSAVKTALGVSLSSLVGKLLDFSLAVPVDGSECVWSLKDVDTDTEYSGTITTELPDTDVLLRPIFYVNSGSGNATDTRTRFTKLFFSTPGS